MVRTPLCHTLGIDVPVFCAPMGGGNSGPALAAAVSNAGGFGLLGMGGVPAPAIRESIQDTRRQTSRPFGVGLLLPFLQGGEMEACLAERIDTLFFFWGDPTRQIEEAKGAGIRVFAQVGSVEEAQSVAAAGADAIVAQGFEAGGHVRGTTSLTTLVPAVVDAVAPIPVVAAGGIANGQGLAAALGLGAQAVSMGTRFLASEEARASRAYKERVVRARAEDTEVTNLFDVGWPDAAHRVLRNKALEEWEAAGRPQPGKRPREGTLIGKMPVAGVMTEIPRYAVASPIEGFDGDLEYAALYAGESCNLVDEIKPAAEIVRDIVAEATATLRGLAP